jgi:hypothetical protein
VSDRQPLPDALRRALEADRRPVRPLPPPPRRVSWVALWAGLLMLVLLFAKGIRNDAAILGFGLCWGAAVLECLTGLAVVLLALREAVPGSGASLAVRISALVAVPVVKAAVAVLTWMRRGMPESQFPPEGAHCIPMESTLALPALALTLFLAARAYAVRPRWAGVLGGAGVGLLTDGVWHLICPFADLGHTLLWHGATVLALALFGFLAGSAMEAIRRRHFRDTR